MKKSIVAIFAVSVLTSTFSWAGNIETILRCKGGKGDDFKKMTISFSGEKIESISLQDSNYKYDFKNQITVNSMGQVAAHIDSLSRVIEGQTDVINNINLEFKLINSSKVGQLLILERFTSADEKASESAVRILKCR